MKSISAVLFLSLFLTVIVSKLNAQENFEVDAKIGCGYYVFSDWESKVGLAADLNLGWQANRNCFGLTFSYYNQTFLFYDITYLNEHFASGVYYARQLAVRPKSDLRLGLAISIGLGNYWENFYTYGMVNRKYEAALAPKVFISGHYYFTNHLALSYEAGLRFVTVGYVQLNGELILAPMGGLTYIF